MLQGIRFQAATRDPIPYTPRGDSITAGNPKPTPPRLAHRHIAHTADYIRPRAPACIPLRKMHNAAIAQGGPANLRHTPRHEQNRRPRVPAVSEPRWSMWLVNPMHRLRYNHGTPAWLSLSDGIAIAASGSGPLHIIVHMTHLGGRISKGDCLEIMAEIDDHSVDLVLCDLPYGTTRNKWDSVIPLDALWKEYRRVLKPRGVIALSSQGLFTARLILSNEAWFRYKFVWVKSKPTNFLNARRQPLRQHEDICIFYARQPNYRPVMSYGEPYDKGTRKAQYTGSYGDFKPVQVKSDGQRFPTDTLYCKTAESEAGGRVWHPTQKPVALGRYLIRLFTRKGDVVLDNAFGSGSFLVSAALERRRFIGIEKNEEVHLFKEERIDYIEVARMRLAEVEAIISHERAPDPLYSELQPHSRSLTSGRRGMVDVDEVIRHRWKEAV